MFIPGSAGDFIAKALHLNDHVLIERSQLNGRDVYERYAKYNDFYLSATPNTYTHWGFYEDMHIDKDSSSSINMGIPENNVLLMHVANHMFSELPSSVADINEIRFIVDCSDMYQFVICNAYKKYSPINPSYMYDYENEIIKTINNKISLKRIVASETSFLREYYNITSQIGVSDTVDEKYVALLYRSWKTTVPTNYEVIEDYYFKGCK